MALHFRHAELSDLPRCLELTRRWGRGCHDEPSLERLPAFWEGLVRSRLHALHVLVDDAAPAAERVRGVASGVFISREEARRLETAPRPFIARRLVADRGASLLLDYEQVARSQREDGVDALGLDFALVDGDWRHPGSLRWLPAMLASAHDWLDGFRVRSFHREVFGLDLTLLARAAGLPVRRPGYPPLRALPAARRPALLGMTEAEGRSRPGSMGWMFFQSAEPTLAFSQGERDLLLLALRGLPDELVAARLHVSLHTVQKRWRTVFAHVAERRPDLSPPHEPGAPRGAERRGPLLAYLRVQRQELRPRPPGRRPPPPAAESP